MNTNIEEVKTKAIEIFRNNEINKAIDYLLENLDDNNEWKNQLILLSSKNNMLERDRISNIISKKKYGLAKNRIYSTFPEIVNSLEEPYEEVDTYTSAPYYISSNYSSTYTPNESLLISIIVLLILILIGIIFILFKLN